MPAKSKPDIAVLIVAGGSGTRFWPLSTPDRPKQFITLFGQRSMLQETFDRVEGLAPPERIMVLTGERFVGLVRGQLPEIPPENIIGEPAPRDTAAAMTLGTVLCRKRFGDIPILVLPADHLIKPVSSFRKTAISAARAAVEDGAIYTFGIKPTWPSPSYGYLERGPHVRTDDKIKHYELARFKEKPDIGTAQRYLEDGRYFWNSGIFVWTPQVILDEVRRFLPEHHSRISGLVEHDLQPNWEEKLKEAFEPLEKISIDFGVMEKSGRVRMIQADFQWSDVGGWLAIESFLETDRDGNRARGDVKCYEAENNIVYCDSAEETVALVGVRDLVVVRAGAYTLVTHKDRTEEVKKLVQKMIHHKSDR